MIPTSKHLNNGTTILNFLPVCTNNLVPFAISIISKSASLDSTSGEMERSVIEEAAHGHSDIEVVNSICKGVGEVCGLVAIVKIEPLRKNNEESSESDCVSESIK